MGAGKFTGGDSAIFSTVELQKDSEQWFIQKSYIKILAMAEIKMPKEHIYQESAEI